MREIAELIGRDASTIFRELRRNAPPIYQGYYLSHKAQERADDAMPSQRRVNPSEVIAYEIAPQGLSMVLDLL